MTTYDREQALRSRLNAFLHKQFGLPVDDYYARLDRTALAGLKSLLSDINNIFTMKIGLEFGTWLGRTLELPEQDQAKLRASILSNKPSTNGFDFEVPAPISVVAEVKCNVPINGGAVYGSAQRAGIIKDITALMEGKIKARINTADYLKFLVLLDTPAVRAATQHLVKNLKAHKDRIVFVEPGLIPNQKDKLYVVYVSET